MNVIFGNFYSPAYDDREFVDETMRLIRELGFNSVMFDTKAWEDFRERYEKGTLSQYVEMQEYMDKSAQEHGLAYNFLLLYMNGDNLYPHIRYSPPIYGEETVYADGRPGKWYKYWSGEARNAMKEHVERILERYGEGCERCLVTRKGATEEVIPVCSMWDPVVAPSFDEEGIRRYREFLRERYRGKIESLNQAYKTAAGSFDDLKPEEYWHSLRYGSDSLYTEEDIRKGTPRFLLYRDNALWKMRELKLYFREMQRLLKEKNPELFLCPDMTQWGYFLNIYGRQQADGDNDYSDLWDTAVRGIDLYELAPCVDSCHFITVPVTPDGQPDAYVVSCQHSMMRVMNEGKPLVGGIYWGRYIYSDIYAFLTPAEMIGTMTACGMDGYTCYGMNGLDDGGVLNRMNPDFLDSLAVGNRWCAGVFLHGPGDILAGSCFGIRGEACGKIPYRYGKTIIPQGEAFCGYRGGIPVAEYVDGKGYCVVKYADRELAGLSGQEKAVWRGAVYSFGVQIGASYAARNIPHVPYEQGNKEMYPIIQSGTTLVKDILERYIQPAGGICERGIETGVFENGIVVVNHRSTLYELPKKYQQEYYQYPLGRTRDDRGIVAGHSAVWVSGIL